MKTLEQFKAHLKDSSGKSWSEDHIQKAWKLASKDLSPKGTDSAVPTQMDDGEPAKPGTDITNFDSIHKAILGLGDLLKKQQECQEAHYQVSKDYHITAKEHKADNYMWNGKMCKLLGKMVGEPEGDSKDDLKPGDPNYHDPNQPPPKSHDPLLLKELLQALSSISESQEKLKKSQKKLSDSLFSLTGQQV